MKPTLKEEYAIILDFLPHGYPTDTRPMHVKVPIAQAIGELHFTLLELVTRKGVFLQPYEKVYIGEGKRDKVHHISGRLQLEIITPTSKINLMTVIKELVGKNEKKFVEFFNKAVPINTRCHQIELLPGIGKKHMGEIIEEREKKPFESFKDLKERVKLIPDPEKVVIKRILEELDNKDKYHIFIGQ